MQDPQVPMAAIPEPPKPASYDCGEECSLNHWLEVYWLVEDAYEFARNTDSEVLV